MRKCTLLAIVSLSVAAATVNRPDFNGTWQLDSAHSQGVEAKTKADTITIRQTEDDVTLNEVITETDGKERKLDLQCKTDGDECKVKQGTVSVWYDGDTLVVMEVRRANAIVVKRRFKLSEDGKTLAVEVNPIAPPGQKPGNLTFVKQAR